jgi:hypothetical protein
MSPFFYLLLYVHVSVYRCGMQVFTWMCYGVRSVASLIACGFMRLFCPGLLCLHVVVVL